MGHEEVDASEQLSIKNGGEAQRLGAKLLPLARERGRTAKVEP
jgi:hypothetical protein